MPIYEFKCPKCEIEFEELAKPGAKVKCPKCDLEAEKMFSSFGFKSDGQTSAGSSCNTCSSSNCGSCAS